MSQDVLSRPIEYVKGIGPEKGSLLRKHLNFETARDLLFHFPFRYVDRSKVYSVAELEEGMTQVQVVGQLSRLETVGQGRGKRTVAYLRDKTGELELVWFKMPNWLKTKLLPGKPYMVFGKPSAFGRKLSIAHPEIELYTGADRTGKPQLQPVYNSTEILKKRGIDSKFLQRVIKNLLETLGSSIDEVLPTEILERHKLVDRKIAFAQIHFPQSNESSKKAIFRLKFEELFMLQLKILKNSNALNKKFQGYKLPIVGSTFNEFYKKHIPFELTGAQKRVVKEIHHDLKSGYQMNRLLQGDVGAGKTLVALLCMLLCADNSAQACMMAPTEILARQHYTNISYMLKDLDVEVAVLTGSTPKSERRIIHERLENGKCQILVGTHALIEDVVRFKKLALAVIDEQHRFGVAQRAKLWNKSDIPPHVLVMTATPIPRTLAMTLYGDLETSLLDELPPGRKPIVTHHFFERDRLRVFGFMKKQIAEGRQVYMVYPLIEESEKLDLNNLMEGYESITRAFPAPEYAVSVVHGRMKAEDKDLEMQRFKAGKTQIMVATTVIEVGVDVANATVMVIENAERFGLSQLHQLRGRVGRGGNQSYCVLITGHKLSSDGRKRMSTMVETNDGFKIAEVDLEIRGPGDMSGTQQSGLPDLKIANLVTDNQMISLVRSEAVRVLKKQIKLTDIERQRLGREVKNYFSIRGDWSLIS